MKFRSDMIDPISPDYYKWHPSGVECIEIAGEFGFNLGNAIKYIWRAGRKDDPIQDLQKAAFYIDREIQRLSKPEECKSCAPGIPCWLCLSKKKAMADAESDGQEEDPI